MSKRHRGPLGWLRTWNSRRLEKRRWRRELLEGLADDDAAIMEALGRLLQSGQATAAALEAGLGSLETRLQALDARVVEAAQTAQATEAAARLPAADGFPVLATANAALLEPELALLKALAPGLAPGLAIDVGAHHGGYSEALLAMGFDVHALEPSPTARAELERRLGGRAGLTVHAVAAGPEDGEADLSLLADRNGWFPDATKFGSLAGLEPPAGMVRAGVARVRVRRLDRLVAELGLPAPAVVKVDAEGFDLEVLRGLGALRPAVLQAEFWDDALPLSGPGARNRLPDLVAHARGLGYLWHLVVFRRWGDDRAAWYAGWDGSPEKAWGNVLWFDGPARFEEARTRLAALLPEARFVPARG